MGGAKDYVRAHTLDVHGAPKPKRLSAGIHAALIGPESSLFQSSLVLSEPYFKAL